MCLSHGFCVLNTLLVLRFLMSHLWKSLTLWYFIYRFLHNVKTCILNSYIRNQGCLYWKGNLSWKLQEATVQCHWLWILSENTQNVALGHWRTSMVSTFKSNMQQTTYIWACSCNIRRHIVPDEMFVGYHTLELVCLTEPKNLKTLVMCTQTSDLCISLTPHEHMKTYTKQKVGLWPNWIKWMKIRLLKNSAVKETLVREQLPQGSRSPKTADSTFLLMKK